MHLSNRITLAIARIRELNKRLRNWLPEAAYVTPQPGIKFYVYPRDLNGPSVHVIKRGLFSYEPAEIATILRLLPENGVFLDVGANIGIFSTRVQLARPDVTTHAFEPHPTMFGCLEKTVSDSGFEHIVPHRLALGAQKGSFRLFIDERNAGGHSLRSEAVHSVTSVPVEVNTLDEFVAENQISRIDLIKVDVQEAERDFIRGAAKTLRRCAPVLLMEVTCADFLRTDGIWQFLEQTVGISYTIHDKDGAPFGDADATRGHFQSRIQQGKIQDNVFFVPEKNVAP